ncbi:MAG: N-acetyl sugar amidotransferase [Candidatus Altiarchaeota archaeon]|nr:N-acetyl sugar amidotransferase [Candidatus Altiarchaeota archaeon]
MRHCKRCVTPDTRPRVVLDEEGVCNACRYAEKKRKGIDWKAREKEFKELVEEYRSDNPMRYDCVVPGSGGKDSIYVAHRIKHDYGMNPLLVTYPSAMYTTSGRNNTEIFRTKLGSDHITFTPNAELDRKLMTKFFELYGDPYLPWSRAVHTIPVKVAIAFRIPLVVYGENPAEYGGPELSHMTVESVDKMAKTGSEKDVKLAQNWPSLFKDGSVKLSDLKAYIYPTQEELDKADIKAVYFGYYHLWDGYKNYLYCKERFDWKPHEGRIEGTWLENTMHSMDDKLDTIYQYLMLLKFGISRAQKEAAPMIRNGHMTREEAVKQIKKVFYEFPYIYVKDCYDYFGMNQKQFFDTLEKFRDRDIWERVNCEWRIKEPIWGEMDSTSSMLSKMSSR